MCLLNLQNLGEHLNVSTSKKKYKCFKKISEPLINISNPII
jgi:hypothetical protein